MSPAGILDKTAGVSKTSSGLLLTATEKGEEVLINEHPSTEMAIDVPAESSLKWTSIFGPLSWTIPGIETGEGATKVVAPTNIWDKPKILAMLREPIGAPIFLTREEALDIAKEAFGSNPDLMPSENFVRQVRPMIGGSILRKLKKSRG